MTYKEAINYLKQLYPNGGHSWLDEQRIEAIGMAIKALQKESASEEQVKKIIIFKHDDKTCKENGNSLTQEPMSEIDFEQELYKYFGQVKDFTLGMRIAKRFYEIGRNYQEPVSDNFEAEVKKLWDEINTGHNYSIVDSYNIFYGLCMDIADWQKEEMMAKAIDAQCFGFQCGALFSFRLPASNYLVGSEVKVIVIKK